ncbi:hypothetical protein C8N44_10772 [Allosediminivita pacifica]|uniref:Uncharacterized protein n=1 Tax=Allosediminivita pacifica TaxID=1267769 RepID=A0A2T6AZI8_9RHOB|nr:hypothetical protein C8N44_10772 [Allosediminivita pacifica]
MDKQLAALTHPVPLREDLSHACLRFPVQLVVVRA